MRIRHYLTAMVTAAIMLASGPTSSAQTGMPAPYSGMPGPYPAYGPAPQSLPQSFSAHPFISPFDNLFEQTVNTDGLWFRNTVPGFGPTLKPRDVFMNIDFTRTKTRKLRGMVGAPGVQNYHQQNDPESDGIVDDLEFYPYFDAASASMIPDMMSNGMRVGGGFWNPDGTGLLLNLHWAGDHTSTYDARANALASRLDTATILQLQQGAGIQTGRPMVFGQTTDIGLTENVILGPADAFNNINPPNFGAFGTIDDILDRTVLNLHGIPIQNFDPAAPGGVTVPYDLRFTLQHSVATLGTSVAGAFSPFYDRGGVRIHMTAGGRYVNNDEMFAFHGADSGLAYNVAAGDNDTPNNAKVFPPGDGIDTDDDFIPNNPNELNDPPGFTQINPTVPILVRSYLESSARSHMAGPELGLHYLLGGSKGARITGSTRVGALFNYEQLRLKGDNIGDFLSVVDDTVVGSPLDEMFSTDNTLGPTANAFSDSRNSTHVSPMFEQSLTAEIPLFSRIPVLRDVWQLDGATARIGWTYLWIGEVADPNQSVVWQSNPQQGIFPILNSKRDSFSQNSISFGLNWNY